VYINTFSSTAQSKNIVIYHRRERRVRRVLRLFQSLPVFSGASAFSEGLAVICEDAGCKMQDAGYKMQEGGEI